MKEDLLQFIWKFKYFNSEGLKTTENEDICILQPGIQNFDQGPDFLNAKIQINNTIWVGNIEVHLFSKQWEQHRHQFDEQYKNVILHVVWKYDGNIRDCNGNMPPTLELHDRVSKILLDKYRLLMEKEQQQSGFFIPCENLLSGVDNFRWNAWKSRLATERLENKTGGIFNMMKQTGDNWEETMWRMVAKNFGGKMNGQLFQKVAETVPQKILARHRNQIIAIEAILFGQAGLLEGEFSDPYPQLLKKEFQFYKNKYHFEKVDGSICFARMRPANFPTIRLAQLAALVCVSSHLFSKLKEILSAKEAIECFRVNLNAYWLYHYKLDDAPGEYAKEKALGVQMIENIMINTVCPMLFAYGIYHKDEALKNKAMDWLENISPEKNSITNGFKRLGVENKSAFDSQALIQLKNFYCDKRRCLECGIGNLILRRE